MKRKENAREIQIQMLNLKQFQDEWPKTIYNWCVQRWWEKWDGYYWSTQNIIRQCLQKRGWQNLTKLKTHFLVIPDQQLHEYPGKEVLARSVYDAITAIAMSNNYSAHSMARKRITYFTYIYSHSVSDHKNYFYQYTNKKSNIQKCLGTA